jgi:hypothetical protein
MSVDSLDVVEEHPPRSIPEPVFEVTAVRHMEFAAAPTMVFTARASEPAGRAIESMALQVQVMIDPARRGYDAATRERLAELFGPPASWTPSTQGLSWARVTASVLCFVGDTGFTLELPCTYDLEVAATKYFYALDDGLVPLSFHFYGTIFYRANDGRLQMTPVPWSSTAQCSMPIAAWQAMIAQHYPGGGWVRLGADTLRALNARRAVRGLTFDRLIEELLDGA